MTKYRGHDPSYRGDIREDSQLRLDPRVIHRQTALVSGSRREGRAAVNLSRERAP
jgi:hypothetical protein